MADLNHAGKDLPQQAKPWCPLALFRVSASLFVMARFVVLAVIGLVRREWPGWLSLAVTWFRSTVILLRLWEMHR